MTSFDWIVALFAVNIVGKLIRRLGFNVSILSGPRARGVIHVSCYKQLGTLIKQILKETNKW
jgi:hypothetical protein